MNTTAQRILLAAGVGFAALLLAQAYFRSGTTPMQGWEWSESAQQRDKAQDINDALQGFASAVSMDWIDVQKVLMQDRDLFESAVRFGAEEGSPGVIGNFGSVEGRPYVVIDDQPYLMNGR